MLYDIYRRSLKTAILKRDASVNAEAAYFFRPTSILSKDLSAGMSPEQLAGVDTSRLALFVASDSREDRYGDRIINDGMAVEDFLAGGSILFGHNGNAPEYVMGRPLRVDRAAGETRILMEFSPEGCNPVADMVAKLVSGGFIRGSSVGILIRDAVEAPGRGGWYPLDILKSELVELSITPVPVNPRALAQELTPADGDAAKAIVQAIEAAADAGHEAAQATMVELNTKTHSISRPEFKRGVLLELLHSARAPRI